MLPTRVRGLARTYLGPRRRLDDRELEQRLLLLVQHTPEADRAPLLTALGLCCWDAGNGAMAREATEAALRVRSDYRMAQLLLTAIQHAVRGPRARGDALAF